MSVAASQRCAVASLSVLALSLAIATGTARGQGISDSPAPEVAGGAPAQANAQQATTGQAAATSADATGAQPTNIFISLRINSPGDNGPVSQAGTTAAAGTAANDAATAQDAWQDWNSGGRTAEGQPQASGQDSGTDQGAAATGAATRSRPTNVVVSVRMNSPGDDAPVTQSSTVVVGAESKNAVGTTQQAGQAQLGAPVGAATPTAAAPKPVRGAVAERPAAAPKPAAAAPDAPVPASCVSVGPSPAGRAATRIVITIGASCRAADGTQRAATRPVSRKHVSKASRRTSVGAPSTAPAAPVVQQVAAATPRPPASSPRSGPTAPRPARAAPRPRASEPKSLDPPAAATKVGDLIAAAAPPAADGTEYEVMLALLLAMLGAAAIWSYGGVHPYRLWRRR